MINPLSFGANGVGWFRPALLFVLSITFARWVFLAFDQTDLYVDESQYWLWGQEFAFGYYSKPPLIGWLIGAVTTLAGSDSTFWVRMPGAFLHGLTALILAALAARVSTPRVALLTAIGYATLPFVALGSLLISTDTVMAPFFAAALYFHQRLIETRMARFAILLGLAAGAAFMAKYIALFIVLGVALAALRRDYRIGWGNAALFVVTFGLIIAPNIFWNLSHQMTTFSHTADNIGWVKQSNPLAALSLRSSAAFVLSQAAVTGPVIFVALLLTLRRLPIQAAFIVPVLLVVTLQALLGTAQANWSVSAYFAGTILAMIFLSNHPRLLATSFLLNGAFCVALPLLVIFTGLSLDGKTPLLDRQLGRVAMSRQIIALAHQSGDVPIMADRRDILADLYYTGQSEGLNYYAPRPKGRPSSHYQQRYPLPEGLEGQVLWVTAKQPGCDAESFPLDAAGGAYQKWGLRAWLVPAECAANG